MWRIDSAEIIRGQHTQFVSIVKVPKEINVISVTASAQVEVDYQWLTGHVRHIFDHLSERIKELLKNRGQKQLGRIGLGMRTTQTWKINILGD
jgi:hypothetical protein